MLDIATAYNKYTFLGNDFLTWIWYLVETNQSISALINTGDSVTIDIGNSLVLENKLGDKSKESITIKGDQAGLEEGTTALKKGAHVTQMNLVCKIGEDEYRFTIKGESLNVTGLKPPKVSLSKNEDEIEGLVLEKSFFCFKIFEVIDSLFLKYLEKRTSDEWKSKELQAIKNWIGSVK